MTAGRIYRGHEDSRGSRSDSTPIRLPREPSHTHYRHAHKHVLNQPLSQQALSFAELDWLASTLAARGLTDVPVTELVPSLTTNYLRQTRQVVPSCGAPTSRLTIDIDLTCALPDARAGSGQSRFPDRIILETKGGARPSVVDRLLWANQHRPVSISKYGVGIASLHPEQSALKWRRLLTTRPIKAN